MSNLKLVSKETDTQTVVSVGDVAFGRGLTVIAGPCSVESEEQLLTTAQAVKAAGGTYWSPYFADLDAEAVTESHRLGLKVSTWGADTEVELAQALATGVDSITTGYVDRARSLMLADEG